MDSNKLGAICAIGIIIVVTVAIICITLITIAS